MKEILNHNAKFGEIHVVFTHRKCDFRNNKKIVHHHETFCPYYQKICRANTTIL